MKIKSYYFLSLLFLFACKHQEKSGIFVKDVSDPIINLDGEWNLCLNPSENFYLDEQQAGEWKSVQVPGEAMMQGFPVKYDEPFAYMKKFVVPEDYEGKKIIIRFEGVYSYARVWINGEYLRDHHGGFTAWDCDVSPYVTAGEEAVLMLEVTDRSDDISYASGYAKHPVGGILRSVSLMALPISYPEDIVITTTLDEQFKNAVLEIKGTMSGEIAGTSINIELVSPLNQNVVLKNKSLVLDDSEFEIINEIQDIMKWDAEHPDLYRMKISMLKDSKIVWSKWYNVGFREVQIEGNIFKVNGKPVKLRGACRHDMHPLLGRVSTREYDLLDVLLAKEANINFIRTSHYPCSDYFLDLCDQYGIFVAAEAAICFVGTNRTPDFLPDTTVNDTAYTQRFLSAVEEMMVNLRHHPSIIIWSIGNESKYGYNIQESFQLAKELANNRPVIFSYPGYVPDSVYSYDIVSTHYPNLTGFREESGYRVDSFNDPYKPVLFDEWLHVPAYNKYTLLQDQNVRSFWGISIDTMWQRSFDTDGCLGGAIWGMIDETFMMPLDLPGYDEWWGKNIKNTLPGVYAGRVIGYGEWGIVDTWRRKKPEFWNTKKGYSPVRVLKEIYDDYEEGSAINIPVYNRFDFTNLNEIIIKYTYKGKSFTAVSPDIPEHSKGEIEISLNNWELNEPLLVEFFDNKNQLIDNYELLRNEPEVKIDPRQSGGQIDLTDDETNYIMVTDEGLKILLNKSTGMLSYFRQESDNVLLQGPYINFLTRGRELAFMSYDITSYEKNWSFIDLSA
jgi:beta-galactosidase